MKAAVVCREYGWTWDEFLDQPTDFINIVYLMLQNEAQVADQKNKTS